jgi:predicted acylesterase/phospholipase RssA
VVSSSIQVMQVRITRSRMAGDPPEAVIAPRLAHLGLLDFHRAAEAIDAGQAATQEVLPLLAQLGLAARRAEPALSLSAAQRRPWQSAAAPPAAPAP